MSTQSLLFDVPFDVEPLVKWAGGKRWQLPELRPLWKPHAHRRLVEPFAGALGVAFGLRPKRALLNDANLHVISFYRWVQRGLEISIELVNDEQVHYRHRAQFNGLVATTRGDTAEAASLFYYLNRTCFNGLCRFNGRGEFNVPFGKYSRISYETDFARHRTVLADWTLTSDDFADVPILDDDFVYADPPYDASFTDYAGAGSPGRTRSAPPDGSQAIRGRWCSPTLRRTASSRCTAIWGSRSASWTRPGASPALATGRRQKKYWRSETWRSGGLTHDRRPLARARSRGGRDRSRPGPRTSGLQPAAGLLR